MHEMQFEPLAGYDAARDGNGYFYDAAKGQRAADFFPEMLTHVKQSRFTAAKSPFKLEPWQDEATRLIFGSVDKHGLRRYRTVYIEVPRKNGKTTWAAGLALFGLVADGEDGAECYCAAADRDQASLMYDVVAGMINNNEVLGNACDVRKSTKRVIYQGSYLKAISSDAHTKHGYNSHIIVCDEMHAWKGRDLWDVLKTSTGARSQPLIFIITTAGHDKQSICYELHEYAEKVRDGKIDDPTFLPMLYGSAESDDWESEKVWKSANPNYGVSLAPEYMAAQAKEAAANPSYQNTFRRLHLNQWTSQKTRWLDMSAWNGAPEQPVEFEQSSPVVGGIDLSTTTDLSAWAMVQRLENELRFKWRFYIPEASADRAEKTDGVPYRRWADMGFVTLTRGARIDYATIQADIMADAEAYQIRQIGFDPWNAEYMQQNLDAQGLEMISVRQGFASLSEPCKQLEAAIAESQIRHGANPVAEWNANNVEVETDANGNIRPVKPKHGSSGKRIDGIVAAVVALAVALTAPAPLPEVTSYDTEWV